MHTDSDWDALNRRLRELEEKLARHVDRIDELVRFTGPEKEIDPHPSWQAALPAAASQYGASAGVAWKTVKPDLRRRVELIEKHLGLTYQEKPATPPHWDTKVSK